MRKYGSLLALQMKTATKNVVQSDKAFSLSGYGQIPWDFQTGPWEHCKVSISEMWVHVPSLWMACLVHCTHFSREMYAELGMSSSELDVISRSTPLIQSNILPAFSRDHVQL